MKLLAGMIGLWLLLPYSGALASDAHAFGGRAAALGQSVLTLSDPWALFNNPAGMSGNPSASAVLGATRSFLQPGMDRQCIGFNLPSELGHFGLGASQFGYSAFREQHVRGAYAREFGKQLSLGIDVHYLVLSIPGYGSRHTLTAGAGAIYHPIEQLRVAARVFNPFRMALSEEPRQELPAFLALALSYHPGEGLLFTLQSEQSLDQGLLIRVGMEYAILPQLSLRAGYSSEPGSFHGGLGFEWQRVSVDLASSFHPFLGVSPSVGISYALGSRKSHPKTKAAP